MPPDGRERSCRFCGTALHYVFVDLGMSPVANDFRRPERLVEPEPFFPLRVFVCETCKLVQLENFRRPSELFRDDYAYFSSYSESWLAHARNYAEAMMSRFKLDKSSKIVELASNDGYLLQFFRARGIPVLGIEPAANVARVAKERGIPTLVQFFGAATAEKLRREGHCADLVVANNVLAHVADINDFVAGIAILLDDHGLATLEFPHLLQLMDHNQFDTIYHEHYSYFSLLVAERIFAAHGLAVFNVEELPTHGGSLRIFVGPARRQDGAVSARLQAVRERERLRGLHDLAAYDDFKERVRRTKRDLLKCLTESRAAGKTMVGYGAPAKGNTLLNYCGIGTDFLDYTVDRNPHKQGLVLPGTGIPIFAPEKIFETRPDLVLILPWNIKEEIMTTMAGIRDWGGRFVVPIPSAQVL
jgi:2-polyprenyl-3-methyl-5-hydroxy-6-metoxy-1,4-benzoquinol methylase